jgi:hypothetical protein
MCREILEGIESDCYGLERETEIEKYLRIFYYNQSRETVITVPYK